MKKWICTLLALLCLLPAACAQAPTPQEDWAAAAYVGYGPDVGSVLRSAECAPLLAMYPFLGEIPALHTAALPGWEVYCIVPAEGVTVVVEAIDTSAEAYPALYAEVLRTASPVLIRCNESDIMPNVQVRLLRGAEERVFTPFMSLRDGSFSAHPEGDGVIDFTLYPDGFIFEE